MSTRQSQELNGDLPAVSEEEFLALETPLSRPAPVAVIDEADIERAGFAPASEENLDHLAPGCFVLVLSDGVYCWSEVVSVVGTRIGARLHNELSHTTCLVRNHTAETVYFHRDQIKALGCERYCWC